MEQITVSAEWLARLESELRMLEQQHVRLQQELRETEARVLAQTGAVGLMQQLLRAQEPKADVVEPDVETAG